MTVASSAVARKLAAGPSTLDLLAKARWKAPTYFPYLGKALWSMSFVVTDKVPTMAVDRKFRVYVNPDHVRECIAESTDKNKIEVLLAGVIHECLHPTLRHAERGKAIRVTDPGHWNKCGDGELVQHIQRAGVRLWSKDLTPETMGWPRGLTAEEYYKLPREQGGGGGSKLLTLCACSGGSGATGQPGAWELPEGAPGPKGLSEPEVMVVRAAVAEDIRKYAKSHGRGSVPAGLLRWAEAEGVAPAIDWGLLVTAKARYHIETRLGPVASYARPSRRDAGGLILPVHRNPRPNVVIVGDTSGSMGGSDIGKIIDVVYNAVESLGAVKALGCDSAAVEPVEVRHIEDLREALRGGGGTSMTAGIEKAAECSPDAIVVVTDGETDWPDKEPECPVIIVLTRGSSSEAVPAWADVIDASEIAHSKAEDDDGYDSSGDLGDDDDDD